MDTSSRKSRIRDERVAANCFTENCCSEALFECCSRRQTERIRMEESIQSPSRKRRRATDETEVRVVRAAAAVVAAWISMHFARNWRPPCMHNSHGFEASIVVDCSTVVSGCRRVFVLGSRRAELELPEAAERKPHSPPTSSGRQRGRRSRRSGSGIN